MDSYSKTQSKGQEESYVFPSILFKILEHPSQISTWVRRIETENLPISITTATDLRREARNEAKNP